MEFEALFSEWYSVVDPGFTLARVKSRIRAATKIAASITLVNAVDLVTVFYSQFASDEFTTKIRAQIREEDETYVSHDKAELAVICAGALYLLFGNSTAIGHTCSLLILCGEFGGLQGSKRIDAIVVRGRDYLIEEGTRARDEPLTFPNIADLLKSATKKLQAATKEKSPGEEEADVDRSFEIHADLLSGLTNFGSAITRSLKLLEKRRIEESSVLYWLLGKRLLQSDEPFSNVEKPLLALLAARDLASQTQQLPGPASCRAILKSVLASGKGEAQQASAKNCLSKISASEGPLLFKDMKAFSPVFMPFTFALEKASETGWAGGWEGAFTAQTKLKATANRPIEEISEQFYRELLLSRLQKKA